ncbi:MAG TPA: acyltransferase [Mycobacteriales bacterium]|nr:acyltransferase [Mycobacteriales bacterium]
MRSALRGIRRAQRSARLAVWRLTTTTRLRARGCRAQISIGRLVDYESLPALKTRGAGNGSVVITIGDKVELGSYLILDIHLGRTSTLSIGSGSMFEHADRLQLWGGVMEIGEGAEIRDDALLKASSNDAKLRLGRQVRIGKGTAVHCHESVELGDRVTLAERVTVVDTFHDVDGSDEWTMNQPIGIGPVRIESNVLVHSGAVVVHGTTLGRNAVVAANALVGTGSYPPGVVLLGNPARAVRKLAKAEDG